MKKIISTTFGVVTILLVSAFTYLSINWNIDPNYSIKFSGKKAEGSFTGLKGTIVFDKNDLANSKFDVTVDANTIKTGNTTKDKHAKGESWFDTEKYPKIKFKSNSFAKDGNGYIVDGTLELHGTSRQVKIPFSFTDDNNNKASFIGSFKLNRKDYGIKGNFFGFAVGDEFDIVLNIPVTKKK